MNALIKTCLFKMEFYLKYKPYYMGATGSHTSAMLLVRLIFWQEIMKGNEFAKKSIELQDELFLSKDVIRRDLIKLQELGLIKYRVKRFNGVPTYHIQLNIDHCNKQLLKFQNTTFADYNNRKVQLSESSILQQSIESSNLPLSITEEDNKKTEEEISFTETSSVVPQLFKSELMQQEFVKAIGKNETAKPKSKKPKEATDPLTAEIHKYTCQAYEFLKQWHEAKYESPMLSSPKDFKNIKDTFRKLIDGSANFEEAKRITPEKCFKGVQYFTENFDKLDSYHQKKFSLNHIATNWDNLLKAIKTPKPAPVAKPNFNEPVPYVHKRLPQYYDGYTLPLGITAMQFEKLAELVMRERIMEGLIDENLRLSGFCQMYRIELHKITEEQLTQLMKDYEII